MKFVKVCIGAAYCGCKNVAYDSWVTGEDLKLVYMCCVLYCSYYEVQQDNKSMRTFLKCQP